MHREEFVAKNHAAVLVTMQRLLSKCETHHNLDTGNVGLLLGDLHVTCCICVVVRFKFSHRDFGPGLPSLSHCCWSLHRLGNVNYSLIGFTIRALIVAHEGAAIPTEASSTLRGALGEPTVIKHR